MDDLENMTREELIAAALKVGIIAEGSIWNNQELRLRIRARREKAAAAKR